MQTENPSRWKHAARQARPGSDWGPERSARPSQPPDPDEDQGRRSPRVKKGLTFCLSLPLDYPGGYGRQRRAATPPRLFANKRNGLPYIAYPARAREDPQFVDVICDDIVEIGGTCNTPRNGTASLMSATLFDADGDFGKPEIVFYNGYPRLA